MSACSEKDRTEIVTRLVESLLEGEKQFLTAFVAVTYPCTEDGIHVTSACATAEGNDGKDLGLLFERVRQVANEIEGSVASRSSGFADMFMRAFALLETAPRHHQVLLLPVVLKASQEPALFPFVELLVSDPHLGHVLSGGEVEPFLDPGPALGASSAPIGALPPPTMLMGDLVLRCLGVLRQSVARANVKRGDPKSVNSAVQRLSAMIRHLAGEIETRSPLQVTLCGIANTVSITPSGRITPSLVDALDRVLRRIFAPSSNDRQQPLTCNGVVADLEATGFGNEML